MTPRIILTVQPAAVSLVLPEGRAYSFDRAGRLLGVSERNGFLTRGLAGVIKEKRWADPADPFTREVRTLSVAERAEVLERTERDLARAKAALAAGDVAVRAPGTSAAKRNVLSRQIFKRLLSWQTRRKAEERRAQRMYAGVGILPPDHYYAVVIRLTEGCPWNRCSFCRFFRGAAHRTRTLPNVRLQIRSIKALLGDGLPLRRSVFLSDANALAVPAPALFPALSAIRRAFPGQREPEGGIFTFADAPAALAKTGAELRRLRKAGLTRVYVGVETGADGLREAVRKPGTRAEVVAALRRIKEAGLSVGVIVMLGLGGRRWGKAHFRDTRALLLSAGLTRGDIVFFSPFVSAPGLDYARNPRTAGLVPLSNREMRAQYAAFKRALADLPSPPLSALYHIDEFLF